MKKFKVAITMAVGLAEDVHYFDIEMEAENQSDVFEAITANSWFHYKAHIKTNGAAKETDTYIQVKHISDIYIREVDKKQ